MGRQLIVMTKPAVSDDLEIAYSAGISTDVMELLVAEQAIIEPVFQFQMQVESENFIMDADQLVVSELLRFYRVLAPDERLETLAESLRKQVSVEAAFIKQEAELAKAAETMLEEDFMARQGYLNPAPEGVDALFAWTVPGGRGAGVRIIDIEGAWQLTHEDLVRNQDGVAGGTPSPDIRYRNHGTAVLGVVSGDRNSWGVTGICPDANVRTISIFDANGNMDTARAIGQAANLLSAGDILLIEIHRPGPRYIGNGQMGFIPIEWWPDDFAAIQFATRKGIIVVEAAGNGGENLDDPVYNTPDSGFPAMWTNPFNRQNRDSGAIIVGAGAPPERTHGRFHGPDRSRLGFSNYGQMVDAQAWGEEVTTTGYGDLQRGNGEDQQFTDKFNGTSSASPIVVGVVGCLQGILLAKRRALLTPSKARELLRNTGSAQQDAPLRPRTQRIGNRPDLRSLISRI